MSDSPFAVIESRWWDSGNHSVRPVFEAVSAIHFGNPSAFFYDMFSEKTSLAATLQARATDKRTEVVYLASHGDENHIGPTAATAVSRTALRNCFVKSNGEGQVKGLFLGTCLTGNIEVARFFLESRRTGLDWLAGYRKGVDWVDGTAIDMIFFSKLAEQYRKNRGRGKRRQSPRAMAHKAASELLCIVPGAFSTYGFNIYFHENGKLTSMFT